MNLLFILLISISNICDAPKLFALKPDGYTLYSQISYIRHGLRTPIKSLFPKEKSGFWKCYKFPTFENNNLIYNSNDPEIAQNCLGGDLIIQGSNQLSSLGQAFRKHLIDDYHFISDSFNTSEVEFIYSSSKRSKMSLLAFFSTLYPSYFQNNQYLLDKSFNLFSDKKEFDFLLASAYHCQDINASKMKFAFSDGYTNVFQKAHDKYNFIFEKYNLTFGKFSFFYFGDYLISLYCTGQKFPDESITDDIFYHAYNDMIYAIVDYINFTNGVAAGAIFRNLIDDIFSQLNGTSTVKLRIKSGHDSTIIAILTSFGYHLESIPPFASHLDLEIWENKQKNSQKFLRFVLNGEILILPAFKTFKDGLIPLEIFIKEAYQYTQYCQELITH